MPIITFCIEKLWENMSQYVKVMTFGATLQNSNGRSILWRPTRSTPPVFITRSVNTAGSHGLITLF